MKHFFVIVLLITLFISCGNSNLLEKYNCTIIETDKLGDVKKSLTIRAQAQLSKGELEELALYLRSQNKNYERLFIAYYLPDMKINTGAWATTHFTPSLEIKILGVTTDEKKVIIEVDLPSGEIIGKWYDSTIMVEHSIIIYLIDGQYKQVEKYKDGSSNDHLLTKSEQNGKVKFVYDNDFGEYYLIESDNSLGLYDNDGLISTSHRIE